MKQTNSPVPVAMASSIVRRHGSMTLTVAVASIGFNVIAGEGGAWQPADRPDDIDSAAKVDTDTGLPFDIRVRGGLWFAAPDGDSSFGGNGTSLSLADDLDLNDPETSFTGDITIDLKDDWEGWQLWFDAFDTSQETSTSLERNAAINGTVVGTGTRVASTVSTTSFGAHVGYDFFDNLLSTGGAASNDSSMRVHLLGGVRALNLDHSIRATGAPAGEYDEWQAILEAGGRVSFLLNSSDFLAGDLDISLNMLGGFGITDGDLYTLDVFTAMTWKPTDNLGISAGYRLFNIDLENVDQSNGRPYAFDAYFAGIFVGAQLTF